jgi:hypothetical protein
MVQKQQLRGCETSRPFGENHPFHKSNMYIRLSREDHNLLHDSQYLARFNGGLQRISGRDSAQHGQQSRAFRVISMVGD